MPTSRQFSLPRARVPWWVWVCALLVHIPVAIALMLVIARQHATPTPTFDAHDLIMRDSARAVPMPYSSGTRQAPATFRAPVASAPRTSARVAPVAVPPATVASAADPVPADAPPVAAPTSLLPRYGDGRLWVQPMVASPREIARTLTGKTNAQLTDSVITAIVQTYLDAMAREQAEHPKTLPSWTTKIGGKTVGLDSKWIYLGPLKIPTMLLALLPIMRTGNPTQAEFNAKLQVMRADLFEAARRAETYDEFKKAVKDLHDQTERAREFKKNQRTAPDTSHRG